MTNTTLTDDNKFKINILLKEYDMLYQEIRSRSDKRFSIISLGSVAAAILANFSGISMWIVLSLWVVFALFLLWWFGFLINRCSEQIRRLEQQINELADADLLTWESQIAKKSLFHKLYSDKSNPPKLNP